MSEVAVIFTPQEAKLWRAQQKLIAQAMKLETGYKKVGRAARGTGRDAAAGANKAKGAASALGGSLRSLAIQYTGVASSIQLVSKALTEVKELRKEAVTAQVSVAVSQIAALKNLGNITTEQKLAAFEQAQVIREKLGASDVGAIQKAIGEGFSAQSSSVPAVLEAAEVATSVNILTPEDIPTMTGALLDVARGSGSKDMEANLGLLLSAGKESRVVDPAKLTENLAPLISSGTATVPKQDPMDAAREIAVILGITTREATDVMGRRTATGDITLFAKMETLFRKKLPFEIAQAEKKEKRQLEKLSPAERKEYLALKALVEVPEDPGTIYGRVEAIAKRPALARTFQGPEGFGERRNQGGIAKLLDANSDVFKSLERIKKLVDFDKDLTRQVQLEVTTSTPEIRLAVAQARSEGNLQQAKLDERRGIEGLKTEVLEGTLKTTRLSQPFAGVGKMINTTMALAGVREEIDVLKSQLDQLEHPAPVGGMGGIAGQAAGKFAEMATGQPLPQVKLDTANIRAVKAQIKVLEDLQDSADKLTENQKQPQTVAPAVAPPPVPAEKPPQQQEPSSLEKHTSGPVDSFLKKLLPYALPKPVRSLLPAPKQVDTSERRERLESFAAMGEQPPVEVQPAPVQVQEAAQPPVPHLVPEQPIVQVAPPQVAITQEPQGREPAPIEGAPDKSLFDKFIGLALPKFLAPLAEQRKPAAVAQIPQPPQVEVTNDIRQGAPDPPSIQVQPSPTEVQNVVPQAIPHRVPEQAPPIVQVAPPELPEEQQVREPAQTKQEPARVEQQAPAGIDSKWEEFKREKEKVRNRGEEALLQASTALERAAAALAANTGLQLQAPAQPTAAPRPSYSNDQRAQAVPA